MNQSKIKRFYNDFTFRKAIWLAPLAYIIHQIEETVFGFTIWREKYFHASQTLPIPVFFAILMAVYLAYIIIHNLWSNRVTAWFVLAAILAMQFHNGIYHLGGTLYFGEYSPGLVTGLIIYIPLNCLFLYKAYQEELINKTSGILALIYAGVLFWSFEFLGNMVVFVNIIISAIIFIAYYMKVRSAS